MITFEGQGVGTIVWTVWQAPAGMPGLPTHFAAYCSNAVDVTPVQPCAMKLPSVAPEQIWWPIKGTDLGSRVKKMDIGYLNGSKSPLRDPLPCQHSTVTGTVMDLGFTGISNPVKYTICELTGYANGSRYRNDGLRCSFMVGRPTNAQTPRAYDQNGYKQKLSCNLNNQRLWGTNTVSYAHVLPAKYPSAFAPYYHLKIGEWYATAVPKKECLIAFKNVRHSWKHVSANVWIEEWWQIYHHNASYVPKSPIGADGYGYVFSSVKRTRTHTLHSLQQRATADFRGMFDVEEECVYEGWIPNGFSPKRETGKMKGSYSYIAQLLILEPGLCTVVDTDLKEVLDAYCATAPERASILYDEKLMVTARSNAVADVTGLDSNWLENLSQVKGTLDVVKPLIAGYKAVINKDFDAGRSALASAYLAYKYSVAPTMSDYKDVSSNIKTISQSITKYRFSNERRRGACHSTCNLQYSTKADLAYHCTLHYQLKDNSLSTVWNALEKLGLDPSIGNLWDFVPYSFVVDWFLHIGPALSRISQYVSNILTRDLKWRVQSFKVQWVISESEVREFGLRDSILLVDDLT